MNTDRTILWYIYVWNSLLSKWRDRCWLAENYFTNNFFRRSCFWFYAAFVFSSFSTFALSLWLIHNNHYVGPLHFFLPSPLVCMCVWLSLQSMLQCSGWEQIILKFFSCPENGKRETKNLDDREIDTSLILPFTTIRIMDFDGDCRDFFTGFRLLFPLREH